MKLVRILLPINQQGTTEACRKTAFGLAQRFGVRLEAVRALHMLDLMAPNAARIAGEGLQVLAKARDML